MSVFPGMSPIPDSSRFPDMLPRWQRMMRCRRTSEWSHTSSFPDRWDAPHKSHQSHRMMVNHRTWDRLDRRLSILHMSHILDRSLRPPRRTLDRRSFVRRRLGPFDRMSASHRKWRTCRK